MFKIIKRSNIWFILSGSLMALSIVAIAVFGLRLGIDYKGGTVIEFKSTNGDKIQIVDTILRDKYGSNYQLKEGGDNSVVLRLPVQTASEHNALSQQIKEKISDYNEISYDSVGPTISRDLTQKSILAVVLASIGIIVYIAYAFRKVPRPLSSWKFGTSAVIAIIHDLLITTGIVVLIGHFFSWMEIDALFVTALLTIMGFSVHDTIVVYDRLRENFIKNPHQDIELTTEESVNQTLARSINTSMTVIIVLLALYLLGGASIKHFILTLIIGIFFGTYSSIFVAAAIVVRWHKKRAAVG
jgi:preprotein translocase subunit SecF